MKRETSIKGGHVLPKEYAELEYIESTGTQYVNLGLNTSSLWKTYVVDGYFECGGSPAGAAFGTHYWGMGSSGMYWWDFGGEIRLGEIYHLRMVKEIKVNVKAYVNDVLRFDNSGSDWTNSYFGYSLHVFKLTNGSLGKWKCYGVDFSIDGEPVRKYVPALRKSDDRPGLYDLCGSICPLTGTSFYVNAGSGEFLYN